MARKKVTIRGRETDTEHSYVGARRKVAEWKGKSGRVAISRWMLGDL